MKRTENTRRACCLFLVACISLGFCLVSRAAEPGLLTITQALEIAKSNSLERQLAQSDLRIARAKLAESLSAFGPRLSLSGGYYHYDEVPALVQLNQDLVALNNAVSALSNGQLPLQAQPSNSLNYYGYQLQLTQPLYTGHKLTAARDLAQAGAKSAEASLDASDNDRVLNVKQAYYTVVYCQQMALTMDQTVASMAQHLEEVNAYFKVNLVPKLDVLQAEAKLADLKQKQLLAQNNLNLAKSTLNFVLGTDLGLSYSCEDSLSCQELSRDLAYYQQQALALRPDLAATKSKVEMARQAVLLAQSADSPTVALVANEHHYEPINEAPATTIGVVATMKLFDNGTVSHQIAAAEDALQKAQTSQELEERSIKLQVEQAFRNVEVAFKTIEVAQKSLSATEEALRVAETRYKVGLSTSLERLDAELDLTQAKTNYTQALSMYHIALAQLDWATGQPVPTR